MSKITHVLIFSGEVPETVLCGSLEDATKRVADAFLFEDEDKQYFLKNLEDDDFWTLDQNHKRFHFSIGVSEVEDVDIYVVAESNMAEGWMDISTAPKDGTTFLAYGKALIDEDFNPEGVALCAWQDDAGWAGSVWDGQFDLWHCESIEPTHWKAIDTPANSGLSQVNQ